MEAKITGVIIARFQTPYLHKGQTELIDQVRAKHNKVIVVLGVAPVKGSKRNPYDFYTREKMIKEKYNDIVLLPLGDHPSDEVWSANLDKLLTSTFQAERFLLYGGRDSFIKYYKGKLQTEELPELGPFSGTEIRKEISDKVIASEDFRAGINYAYYNMYAKVYPTVDIVVFRNHRTEVLLGKKATLNQWRFIGGFVDPEDDNFEMAAKRELQEECGNIEVGNIQYVGTAKIDDWRYRNEADKIITTFFSADLIFGNPQPADDIVETGWHNVIDLAKMMKENKIVAEHLPLFEMLLKKENINA
jgi:bifunctional NMN adenylyltransferase/nudix hydrolase